MTERSLEDRVARIEKVFWVVAALAVVFGLSGAWGITLLQGAKAEIDKLQRDVTGIRSFVDRAETFVANAKAQIENEKVHQLAAIAPAVKDLAQREVKAQFQNRAGFAKVDNKHITSLGRHSTVRLRVKKGDIIHASFAASAKSSEFYYRIVDVNGLADPLMKSTQVIQNASQPWRSIAAHELFRADSDRELQLAIEFFKSDVSGNVQVYGSTLVAVVVAADG